MLSVNMYPSALHFSEQLRSSGLALEKAMQSLSNGRKVGTVADDAIANRLTGQIIGLTVGAKNIADLDSMLTAAQNGSQQTLDLLQKARELSVAASNDNLNAQQKTYIQKEMSQTLAQIDEIGESTVFNKTKLFDGSFSGKIQLGETAGKIINYQFGRIHTQALGLEELNGPQAMPSSGASTSASSTHAVSRSPHADGAVTENNFNPVQLADDGSITTVGTTNYSDTWSTPETTINGETYASYTRLRGDDAFTEKMSTLLDAGDTVIIDGVTTTVKETDNTYLYVYGSFNDDVNNVSKLDNGVNIDTVIEGAFSSAVLENTLSPAVNGTATAAMSEQVNQAKSTEWKIRHPIADIDVTINPEYAIDTLDGAILQVLALSAEYGALQNRLAFARDNLLDISQVTEENRSRLIDANFAVESANLIKAKMLQRATNEMIKVSSATQELILNLIK